MQPMAVTSPQEECRVGTYPKGNRSVSAPATTLSPIEMSLTVP